MIIAVTSESSGSCRPPPFRRNPRRTGFTSSTHSSTLSKGEFKKQWLWWTFATEEDQDNENPNWILFLPMHCNVAGLIEEKVINMRNMMMDYLISDHWSQIHNTCRALPCPPTKIHHWEEGRRQILPEARIRNWLWKKSAEQCSVTITSLPFSLLSPPAPLPPTLPPPLLNLNRFGEFQNWRCGDKIMEALGLSQYW